MVSVGGEESQIRVADERMGNDIVMLYEKG